MAANTFYTPYHNQWNNATSNQVRIFLISTEVYLINIKQGSARILKVVSIQIMADSFRI